jgi:diaminopimelate epimerase
MGNPHAVLEVDDIERAPLETTGRALQNHPAFPASCNVGFVEVVDRGHVRLRVLERGAGETRACGSGACAAAAWLARQGRVASRVRVTQAGGTLWVETDPGTGTVTLEGPAAHVFEGTLE